MAQPTILVPNRIQVTEKYVYQSRISGVRHTTLTRSTGTIDLTFPYDRRKYVTSRALISGYWRSSRSLARNLMAMELGYLEIDRYGYSNLNRQPDLVWEENKLPIKLDPNSDDLLRSEFQNLSYCDLKLRQVYQPATLGKAPIRIEVEILDEDYVDEHTESSKSEEKMFEHLITQAGLKHTLIIKFKVTLELPSRFVNEDKDKTFQLSRMALTWPIATPHRLVKLSVGKKSLPLIYDAEAGIIEWNNVPLSQSQEEAKEYISDWIYLEISEPAEIYQHSVLFGRVEIKMDSLLSNLTLKYQSADETKVISPSYHTVLVNKFTLNLQEGLDRKCFSPRQHLYFPGVVLNEMRRADILMLLKDKGFEPEKAERRPLTGKPATDETSARDNSIKAVRYEGAKRVSIALLMQGRKTSTTRERKISGEAKYTTPLPTGDLHIYIRGQLPGDSKRIVTMVNGIQKQLKERFRHVGSTE